MSERAVRVRALRWEADGVVSLELEAADGAPLPPWEPGAHLDLVLPEGLERQYSLCGRPDASTWRVAVRREADGRGGSAWVHDRLRPGTTLPVRGPRNHFALVDAPAYLFIAGGIGITPLLPMAERATAAGREWRLHYGGRSRVGMAFVEELAGYGERVALYPRDEGGRIDLEAVLDDAPADAAVYCCGPPSLVDTVVRLCAERDRQVSVERFAPVIPAEAARAGDGFEVQLLRSGVKVEVAGGQSILEAVEAAGVWPPSSCLEGTCGTCETRVVEGRVDHRDSILTEAERASGETMLICVSRADCARLVLDL
ncbi:PDR/VanB family oxidoreductase [Streptomyces spongiae]|uniref:Oxidoreductase n=1 Tax=Streptomyces spongiae TaxID=565072 RepID=A0A5N8XAR8_9ACTN|nr:PDR/VanB family oxidoreductase [Streptomyces spongiae]MPY56542.1 oxidoreductase [Streptomyces spongiae]